MHITSVICFRVGCFSGTYNSLVAYNMTGFVKNTMTAAASPQLAMTSLEKIWGHCRSGKREKE